MSQGVEEVTPVYLRSADHAWIPALQLKVHSCRTKATVAVPVYNNENEMLNCETSSESYKFRKNQVIALTDYTNNVLPMQNVDCSGNLGDHMDMVDLPFMHEVSFSIVLCSSSDFI
jgi:hypothetical protein